MESEIDRLSLRVLCHMDMSSLICQIGIWLKALIVKPLPTFHWITHVPASLASSDLLTQQTVCFLTQRWCFTSFMFKKMFPGVSTCDYSKVPQSISFSGSGFMATYQLGVAQCFMNYAPWLLRTAPRVLGASAGSLVAAAVVCEVSLSKWITWFICVRGVLKSLKPFLTFLNLPMPLWMWCA